jgi:hypothetical protein
MLVCAAAGCGRVNFDARTDGAVGTVDAADTSLIAHYELEDVAFDGVIDSTGHGHTGFCQTSCPVVQPGKLGNAYQFNGTTDAIGIADAIDLRPANITVTLWFFKTVPGQQCPAQKLLGGGALDSWQLITDVNEAVGVCTTRDTSGACDATAPATYMLNRWHHFAYVATGTRHLAYLDGIPVLDAFSAAGAVAYDGALLLLGADIDFGTTYCFMQGRIDDVRIYGRVLDPAEILALAAQ